MKKKIHIRLEDDIYQLMLQQRRYHQEMYAWKCISTLMEGYSTVHTFDHGQSLFIQGTE